MAHTARFPYPGAIDADGHILEPPDTWEKYIDPQFRDRAVRITTDPRQTHFKCYENQGVARGRESTSRPVCA